MSDELGAIVSVTHDGFSVSTNEGSAKDVLANLEAEPKPLDGTDEDEARAKEKDAKKKRSEAASELGKAGGKASADARATAKDDPAEDGEEKDESKAKEPEKKAQEDEGDPRHDAKARIKELAREKREARDRADALEARLKALEEERAKPDAAPAKEAKAEGNGNGKPELNDFENYEEWIEAVTDWKVEERLKKLAGEAQEKARVDAHTESLTKRLDTFRERVNAKPEVLDRVDPRLLALGPSFTLPPGTKPGPMNDLAEEIISSEVAPDLMVYLSEHEDEVRRILASPDRIALAKAVAKLEDRIAGVAAPAPAPTKPSYSQAKPPVRPLPTSATASEEDLSDDVDFDTHYRVMTAREKRAARR